VAIAVLLLLHAPGVVASLSNMSELPAQVESTPPAAVGAGVALFTVTVTVAEQPDVIL
jgi:hypothetical protein